MGWLIWGGYDGMVDVIGHLCSSLRWSFRSSLNANRNAILHACSSGETFMIILPSYLSLSFVGGIIRRAVVQLH